MIYVKPVEESKEKSVENESVKGSSGASGCPVVSVQQTEENDQSKQTEQPPKTEGKTDYQ